MVGVATLNSVVLVEGNSDRVALLALASRLGRDLASARVEIAVMNGITNTRTFAQRYGPQGLGVGLAGLYDAPDEAKLRRGLLASGLPAVEAEDLPALGFFKCTDDLEDELLRALGVEAAEAVIEAAGESHSLRLLTGMPAQREWTRQQVLKRFLSSKSGRKALYAGLFVDALPLDRAPEPLVALLDWVRVD